MQFYNSSNSFRDQALSILLCLTILESLNAKAADQNCHIPNRRIKMEIFIHNQDINLSIIGTRKKEKKCLPVNTNGVNGPLECDVEAAKEHKICKP